MRLIPLEIGRLEASMRIISGEDTTRTFPIPSWLVEHQDGLILFDTGLHPELRHDVSRIGASARFFVPDFGEEELLTNRLLANGFRPADITHMVFSHLHFDHCGGTAEIPDARVVVQSAEWSSAHSRELVDRGVYFPEDFDLGHSVQEVEGQHDLFGDGKVICLPTPGHTAGHQSLRLELESGPHVLTGDCVYFETMMEDMTVPRFGHDTKQQIQSMKELKRLRDTEGCTLLYGHDEPQFRALPPVLT